MGIDMQNQSALAVSESKATDLFALSDEQILEIEPEAEVAGQRSAVASAERTLLAADGNAGTAAVASATSHQSPATGHKLTEQRTGAQPQLALPLEPPAWLAAQMKDPWGGEEAREFWDGVQQARSEAAAYRAAFATPEDARALKELYPGGVSEARAAAERGRLLEEIDRAYFGAAGNSPEQASASRAHVAAYAAFERAANEDLERSVGGAIERTLAQALPAGERRYTSGQAGAQPAAPLQQRLAQAIRQDVEKALQGDRQLGEQVAQILSSRRFDSGARTQVVRLIADRAQQLVPGAAKRVLNEWTQTTLAAHRGRTQRADALSASVDLAPAHAAARPVSSEQRPTRRQDAPRSSGQASATKSQPINYRKLSDEQILDL